jgi:hypothetical protein
MRTDTTDAIRGELAKAGEKVEECDTILIIMERRTGGLLYFANDSATLAGMNWLCDSMKHQLHKMAAEQ